MTLGRSEALVAASEALQAEGLTWEEAEERLDDPWAMPRRAFGTDDG